MSFIDLLAWVFGCSCMLIIIIQFINRWGYPSSIDKIMDGAYGRERTYPVMKYLIVAVICLAWLLSKGVLI